MAGRRRLLALSLIGATLAVVAVASLAFVLTRPPDPLDVVQRWTDARNRGDVDASMELLADTGNIFGIAVHLPGGRDQLREIFSAQAIAGWTLEDSDCAVDGDEVRCRYAQKDRILDRWGLAFTGAHRYRVRDGKLAFAERIHDPESREAGYDAIDAFRSWVRTAHPDVVEIIWSTPGAALYTTPAGARAALELLDEYEASKP